MGVKVLGQSAPSATTNTDVYTVPSGKTAAVSTLTVCNRAGTQTTYRVAVRPAGASLANQHYVCYDAVLPANSTDLLTIGISLDQTDVVTVYSGNGSISFSVFGNEQ